ncbi:MAG TPA: hypothetical protein VL135_14255 [Terracidiphilus sp.]|nr:hypothetical protein [Terracidiphilus sp.]
MIDKRWFFVGVLVVGVFLAVIVLLPFFLNADAFRPTIETQLSNSLGRTVTMGKLSFSLMQASLIADEVVISDDPAFSDVPFLQAKALAVGIEIIPLLSHREVRITGLTLDTPSIQLIQHATGKWNFSSLGSGASQSALPPELRTVPDLTVKVLKIVNGSALVSSIPQSAKPFGYSEVNLTAKQFSFSKSFPFELSTKLPGNGTLNLIGDAGPISLQDVSQTPFHGKLQVREFNPVAAGIVDQSKGISMSGDIDADLTSDGANASSIGKLKASQMKLVPKGSPAQEPVDIDYSISQNLVTREGNVADIAIHAGSSVLHVKGTFKPSTEGLMLNLHLSAPALPINEVGRLLPAVGMRLPSGSSLEGGTLTANIAITGPATAATMTGPVEVDNTRLAGFDLGSRIEGLNPLPGSSGGTDIRVLKATVNSSPQDTRLSDISAEVPPIGTASGNGNVALPGELDFRLTAKLTSAAGRSIPISISGTAANPSIRANTGAALR